MRLLATLRSRRLAIWLLVGVTAYSFVSTLVPLESVDPVAAARWDAEHPVLAGPVNALGLHRAFSSPIFIAVAALLTVSTALCAWERSAAAWRWWRSSGVVPARIGERLRSRPDVRFELSAGEASASLEVAARALSRLGFRGEVGPRAARFSSQQLGLVGSPLFHWALVGLFLFGGLGQLARYEGFANVLEGGSFADEPDGYNVALYRAAPFAPAHTGSLFTVEDIDPAFIAEGVVRGATPRVTLSRDGSIVASGWVHPNSPLRDGALLVHRARTGPALELTLVATETGQQQAQTLYFDTVSGPPESLDVQVPTTEATYTVTFTPVPGQRVAIAASGSQGRDGATVTAGPGDEVGVAPGLSVRIDRLAGYVQLKVVNDPWVPAIYLMFVLGTLGVSLTVFLPPRAVYAFAVDGSAGSTLSLVVEARRSDPALARRVEAAIAEALGERGYLGAPPVKEGE